MTGKLYLCDGTTQLLPPLLSWRVCRTDGVPADSFSLIFQYGAKWDGILMKAVRFEAIEGGKTRFFGVVDEYEVEYDRDGLLVTVCGRGMSAVLLDNEVGLQEFWYVRLSDILARYVTPYGIETQRFDQNYQLLSYVVEYGETCWRALCGFCLWAGGVLPRFTAEGKLVITAEPGAKRTISADHVERASWDVCRYGAFSSVVAKNLATGLESTVHNYAYEALGGNSVHRMTIPKKNTCRASNSSPAAVLWESARNSRILKVTLRGAFLAEPGDLIPLKLPKLGLSDTYQVAEAESFRDGDGTHCCLTLREYR